MKNLLVTTALSLVSFGAVAADLPTRAPAPAPVYAAPVFTWAGFYAGVQVGYQQQRDKYGSTDSDWIDGVWVAAPVAGVASLNDNGFLGGVHVGYNYQTGSIVLGLEADLEGVGGKNTYSVYEPAFDQYKYNETWSASTRVNWQASLRARLGYSFDRALIYVTAGLALADVEATYANTVTNTDAPFVTASGSRSNSDVRTGYTIGAGVQYALTNAWSVRAEYRYTNLGTLSDNNVPWLVGKTTGGQAPGYTTREQHDLSSNSVRVGLTYTFGAKSAPVVARY